MTKSAAQLDAEIAEAIRAKKWQAQVEREDRERRARLARQAASPTPRQLYEEHQSDLGAGVFHGEQRGRARQFRRDRSTRKKIPDAVKAEIEVCVTAIIQSAYRRYATHGGKEPCLSVGLIVDDLRQQSGLPNDFRYATKTRQRTWTRSVLESMRRRGQIGSSSGVTSDGIPARCYEPIRGVP